MKLLPEVPTQEMIDAAISAMDTVPEALHDFVAVGYQAMYAAAPDVKDEPVFAKHQPCGCVVCTCDGDRCLGCGARNCGKHPVGEIPNPVFSSPSPRIAELEAEVVKLREALQLLHDNLLEYNKINNLGGENNQDMKMARAALGNEALK